MKLQEFLRSSWPRHNMLSHRKTRRLFTLSLLFFLLTSCMTAVEKTAVPAVPHDTNDEKRLTNASSSIDELCKEVLEKVAQKDIKSLEAMALTEYEFKRYYWPHSEWSRPEVRMPFEFYWGLLHQRSSGALRGTLAKYGEKKFELISVHFAKETMEYQDVKIYPDARLTVRDEEGREREIEMFDSIIELNGDYKIFSYIYK